MACFLGVGGNARRRASQNRHFIHAVCAGAKKQGVELAWTQVDRDGEASVTYQLKDGSFVYVPEKDAAPK